MCGQRTCHDDDIPFVQLTILPPYIFSVAGLATPTASFKLFPGKENGFFEEDLWVSAETKVPRFL